MIWYYILLFFGSVLTAAFSWLPVVETLPLGMDSALELAFGYFNVVMGLIPWLGTLYTAFIWYLGYKITVLILQVMRVLPS